MSPHARARVEDDASSPSALSLAGFFRIPRAGATAKRWHVSPAVDLAAYAFGWAWILVPLALLPSARDGYLIPYLVVLGLTGVHRHFGLPYVYLDGQVRGLYKVRFTVFPALMLAAWAASPWLARQPIVLPAACLFGIAAFLVVLAQWLRKDGAATPVGWRAPLGIVTTLAVLAFAVGPRIDAATGAGGFAIKPVLDILALVAGVWNVWHVYMQKYGILRMYSAKAESEKKVSGYKDRFLLLSWMPLYFAWLGPRYRDVVLDSFGGDDGVLVRVIDVLVTIEPVAVPVGFATVAIAVVMWIEAEWRANGFKNAPRLFMAAGTTVLASAFLFMDPVKVYLAFAFSHAVEYMVFVWAFQRRRYHAPLPHAPLLGRILKHPVLAYVGFIVIVGAAFLYVKFYGNLIAPDAARPEAFGYPLSEWGYYWGIYQSMVHFYFDGFLWKMRLPAVRASI